MGKQRSAHIAQKTAEIVAQHEELSTQDVSVKINEDRNGYLIPTITVETENGTFTGVWEEGMSYSDINWREK